MLLREDDPSAFFFLLPRVDVDGRDRTSSFPPTWRKSLSPPMAARQTWSRDNNSVVLEFDGIYSKLVGFHFRISSDCSIFHWNLSLAAQLISLGKSVSTHRLIVSITSRGIEISWPYVSRFDKRARSNKSCSASTIFRKDRLEPRHQWGKFPAPGSHTSMVQTKHCAWPINTRLCPCSRLTLGCALEFMVVAGHLTPKPNLLYYRFYV